MKEEIKALALENALKFGGKAKMGPIMGRIMALHPELKDNPRKASRMIGEVLKEVNSLSLKDQEHLYQKYENTIDLKPRERRDGLPDLEGAESGNVVMRFAPGPSGPLHIGHSRAALLNDEYCRKYQGKFILRLEDTNPEKIDPDAYQMIPEDLEWLGIENFTKEIQSDRFEIYYDVVGKLLEKGAAYVCTMEPERWRSLKNEGKACPERDESTDAQLERWDRMIQGGYEEGEASLVVKTDLKHPNPAVRDFVGMRIRTKEHPLKGGKYHLFPLYNLSVAIDDHLMGCTHILRGNDHLNNTVRQEFVYRHMGWPIPRFIHYGLVSIPDTILKTSWIREEILKGNYSGWNDIRIGTLRALSSRGIRAGSLREYWKEVGIKQVDITFSWDTLYSLNRTIIDDMADRFFFVPDPLELKIVRKEPLKTQIPLHPSDEKRGCRAYELIPENGYISVFIPRNEFESRISGTIIRLKDLCNIRIDNKESKVVKFEGVEPLKDGDQDHIPIIQWAPPKSPICVLEYPDGSKITGVAEPKLMGAAYNEKTVQFERVGYFKLSHEKEIKGRFAHK